MKKHWEKIMPVLCAAAALAAAVSLSACARGKTASTSVPDFVPSTLPAVRSAAEAAASGEAAVRAQTDSDVMQTTSEIKTRAAVQAQAESNVEAQANSTMQRFAENYKKLAAANEPDPVATVNGVPISRRDFDIRKAEIGMSGMNESDRGIIDQLINNELLYEQAVKAGVTVTDASVSSMISMEKQPNSQAGNESELMDKYIKAFSMTSDQFWAYMAKQCKQQMTIEQYREKLDSTYQKQNSQNQNANTTNDFQTYFNSLPSQYRAKAKINYYLS